jgi:hypothetical protein
VLNFVQGMQGSVPSEANGVAEKRRARGTQRLAGRAPRRRSRVAAWAAAERSAIAAAAAAAAGQRSVLGRGPPVAMRIVCTHPRWAECWR